RLAEQLWPGENPVGRQFPIANPRGPEVTATVVGVVGDMRRAMLEEPPGPEVYAPAAQPSGGAPELWVVVRAAREPLALVTALRETVQRLDPQQPIGDLLSLEQMIHRQEAARRFNLSLIALFAA